MHGAFLVNIMGKDLSMELNNEQFDSLHNLVNEVAQRQLKDFGQINSELKPDGSLITSFDRWSDEHIVRGISRITYN